jgi:hypothetical protein
MTWDELDAMRCNCAECEVEEVDALPGCLRCKTCGGWYGLNLGYLTSLSKVQKEFGGKRD